MTAPRIEGLLRDLAPQVLGSLLRHYGRFDTCEDAVQEALLAAAVQWPTDGIPANPTGWLITVASRRRTELWRSDSARRRREEAAAALAIPDPAPVPAVDDTLTLLLLCCHPSLTPASQVALTLRAVGGLTTAEIARAFLVPEATVGQRISRAKQRIKASGAEFRLPPDAEWSERMVAVLRALYLIFNEGYTASSGTSLVRVELTSEAIRLTRQLRNRLPRDGEVAGLLALMLLTDARRAARTRPDGALVPLAEQNRALWDAAAIAEGVELISTTLATAPIGPYQLQAAIAAVHDEANRAEDTDWREILGLYDLLDSIAPGPMVTLNRIVAVAMVHGPDVGLRQLAEAEVGSAADPALAGHHRFAAVRAHLLDIAGDHDAARAEYRLAARRTLSLPEQRYLESRAAQLSAAPVDSWVGTSRTRRILSNADRIHYGGTAVTMLDLAPATHEVARLLDGVSDDQLDAPTPSANTSVAAILDHLMGLSLAFTLAARKTNAGKSSAPQAVAEHLDPDWRIVLPKRLGELAEAWVDRAAWEGMTEAGGVTMPAETCATVALDELVLHGWDLARATGQTFTSDPASTAVVLAFTTAMAQPENAGGREGLFGPVVDVPQDSPAFDRALGFAGRDPGWTPPPA